MYFVYRQHSKISEVSHQISLSVTFLEVFVKACSFSAFNFFQCYVKFFLCPILVSSWQLIIFIIGLPVTLGKFPSRFMKCSFYICIHSSLMAAFNFALKTLLLLLPSFTVCHAIHFCFGWYSICSCLHVVSNKVFIVVIWTMCFRYLLKSIKFISYSYSIFIVNIYFSKWETVVTCGFDCLYFISAWIQVCLCYVDSVIERYSFKRGIYPAVHNTIYLFLDVNI